MAGPGDKTIRVGDVSYVIDEGGDTDIAGIVAQIEHALQNRTVVLVPVLDAGRNQLRLYLNGAAVESVVLDLGEGSRPGEISPK
jgi:hypothetical protein